MGYLLIIVGLISLMSGIVILKKDKSKVEKLVQTSLGTSTPKNSKEQQFEINKAKGDAFEKFIVRKFDKSFFTIQEWRSDKSVDGVYAISNHFPDLEVKFENQEENIVDRFAIECKWRQQFYNGTIRWAEDYQVRNYKDYQIKLGIPVFVTIGVGGLPTAPNELYIIPLNFLESNTVSKDELQPFKRILMEEKFYWDEKTKQLR